MLHDDRRGRQSIPAKLTAETVGRRDDQGRRGEHGGEVEAKSGQVIRLERARLLREAVNTPADAARVIEDTPEALEACPLIDVLRAVHGYERWTAVGIARRAGAPERAPLRRTTQRARQPFPLTDRQRTALVEILRSA
jgi:hypothetical protein